MGPLQGASGLLDPTVRLGVDLRSREVGQGGVRFTGGEQLLGSGLTCSGGSEANSGDDVAKPEEQGLGEVLGVEAELLRGLPGLGSSGAVVSRWCGCS